MAQLNIDLPKTQEGIDEILKSIKVCPSCITIPFLILWVILLWGVGIFSLDDKGVQEILYSVAQTGLITFALSYLAYIYQRGTVEEERVLYKTLSKSELDDYKALCEKHPELSRYNGTLERLPVMKELLAFRKFGEAAELEALSEQVRGLK